MAKKSKVVGSESHVYNDNGSLAGLYTIDGVKARQEFGNSRFWEGMDEMIRLYREINPGEMEVSDYENMDRKVNAKRSTGANESGSNREAINIPHGLYLVLTDYEPNIFKDKKLRTSFMKRYSFLRSCEVV